MRRKTWLLFFVSLFLFVVTGSATAVFAAAPPAEVEKNTVVLYKDDAGNLYRESGEGRTAVELYLTTLYGASVRISDVDSGLRFTHGVEQSGYDALGLAKDNVVLGALIGPADLAGDDEKFTFDDPSEHYENFVLDKEKSWYKKSVNGNDYYCFNTAIIDIHQTNYGRDFLAQSYITVKYIDGQSITYYGDISEKMQGDTKESNVRSLAFVAEACLNDESKSWSESEEYILRTYANPEDISMGTVFGTMFGNDTNGYELSTSSAMTTIENKTINGVDITYNAIFEKTGTPNLRLVFDTEPGTEAARFTSGFTLSLYLETNTGDAQYGKVILRLQERYGNWKSYGTYVISESLEEFRAKEEANNVRLAVGEDTGEASRDIVVYYDKMPVISASVPVKTISKAYWWNASADTNVKITDVSVKETVTSFESVYGTLSGNDALGYVLSPSSGSQAVMKLKNAEDFQNGTVSFKICLKNRYWYGFRVAFDATLDETNKKVNTADTSARCLSFIYDNGSVKLGTQKFWGWLGTPKSWTYATGAADSFDSAKIYDVRFTVNENTMTIYLDGEMISQCELSRTANRSPLYFWSADLTQDVYLYDIHIETL